MIENIYIADIETLMGYSLFSFFDPKEGKWEEFSINEYENNLYKFVKFLEDHENYYMVFYNGIKFDCQVIQWILINYKKWWNYSGKEIAKMIWQFAQDVIDDTMHEVQPPYREDEFKIKQIDVLEIPHFSNKSKRTSLKWLEFMMDAPNIEEMPYHHKKEHFTREEIEEIKSYCRNDIENTYRWYLHLRGNVEHAFYKDNDKIQHRLDLIEELGFPKEAISWNDVKIGDEINKRKYLELTGKSINDLYNLKKARKPTKPFKFGDAIPSYVEFHSPDLQAFYNRVRKEKVSLENDKQKFPITFKGTTYSIMRGGIHSTEKNRIIIPKEDEILRDADIGAQYPNAIIKRNLFPSHLGPEWLVGYKDSVSKKDRYKQLGKQGDKKAKGLEKMYKLALNGGGYGKLNEPGSWQYDPKAMYYCTIGNQFEILMLIEMLELEGIHCVSANTDGIVCLFKKSLNDKYYEICHKWEEIVGNHEMGKLEYQDYIMLAQESINHYVAKKPDGSVKVKGRFLTEDEMHKNNTDKIGRIERKAIVEYFKNKTPIEQTIHNSKNIFDFCIGLKSSRKYHFETIKENKITEHKKVIRFYISNDGEKLTKVLNDSEDEGIDITHISRGNLVQMFNTFEKKEDYNINYEYYINNAQDIIDKIERGKKTQRIDKNQLSLF